MGEHRPPHRPELATARRIVELGGSRWSEENWFKKRTDQCNNGRGFLAVRRQFIFLVGCLALAIYGLLRGILCPRVDVKWVSRHYTWPQFILSLPKPGD